MKNAPWRDGFGKATEAFCKLRRIRLARIPVRADRHRVNQNPSFWFTQENETCPNYPLNRMAGSMRVAPGLITHCYETAFFVCACRAYRNDVSIFGQS
jgi:hypothetical protein